MIRWQLLPSRILLALKLEWRALRTPGCGIGYVVQKWFAVIFNRRRIRFLGRDFQYQDRLAPFMIFDYVNEVQKTISLYDFEKRPLRVLEIGGNIGNWGVCWMNQLPDTELYTFEPNPEPFEILKANSREIKNWKIFKLGVGAENSKVKFFFVPNKSGQGSIFKENANKNLLGQFAVNEIEVEIRHLDASFCKENLGGAHFDFIKIDVEGAEWEVLKGMSNITWSGMYVELNLINGNTTIDEFTKFCQKKWPTSKLLMAEPYSNGNCDVYLLS